MDSQVLPLSNKNAGMGNFRDEHLLLLLSQVISTPNFAAIQISGELKVSFRSNILYIIMI